MSIPLKTMCAKICLTLLTLILAEIGIDSASAQFPRPRYRGFFEAGGAVVYAPKPGYPFEARLKALTGSGAAVLDLDPSGAVTHVEMAVSTGHEILDNEAMDTFRQWRFKPGTPSRIQIPITFGAGGAVSYEIKEKKSRSMEEMLAGFLGKGMLINGPIPKYPPSGNWTDKQGTGKYELHVEKDGKVSDVKILKSSGDATFDRVTVETLKKWRSAPDQK